VLGAIAVRERKHLVFSDTGFGTGRVRSLALDRLCSAVCAAGGFPGWDASDVRAIWEQISPPAKRKLHLRQGGDQEPLKNSLPNTPSEKTSFQTKLGLCHLSGGPGRYLQGSAY